jgi:hypothetical protein
MSEHKHTPGPWHYRTGITDVYDINGNTICELYVTTAESEQGQANRRLIAAAPDLLYIVENLIEHDKIDQANGFPVISSYLIKAARAAIAKATNNNQ